MAITSSLIDAIGGRRRTLRHLSLSFSGNYSTGGDTLDLTQIQNPSWIPAARSFAQMPSLVAIVNRPDGFAAEVIPGSSLSNFLVKWFTAESTELAAGPYPAAITSATDVFAELVTGVNV
ncbi:MAG: hypothetical protein ACRD1Y_13015 [Terriglobales bacterium]